MCWCECFLVGDGVFVGLMGVGGQMQGLVDCVVDGFLVELQYGFDVGGYCWVQVGDMVDFVFV